MDAAYDFIVCGGGTSGCAVAARLAQNRAARVLLLEAGTDERVAAVRNASIWMSNIGSERDWQFEASRPQPCWGVAHRCRWARFSAGLEHQRLGLGAGTPDRL